MEISQFINFRDKWQLTGTLLLLTVIGFVLHWLGYWIYWHPSTPAFIKESPEPIVTVIFLVYLVTFFILIKTIITNIKINFLHWKNKTYKFNNHDWPIEWIFNGRPETKDLSELLVQTSRAGCLLKNHYWKDFKMTFELKFTNDFDKTLGLVFRAEDLDNYFMLEISSKHNEVKPHVRYNGGWDVIYPVHKDWVFNEDYVKVVLEVRDDTASLFVKGLLEFTWVLPTHVDVMYRESNGGEKTNKTDPDEKYVQEISFRKKLGMIGFRAHPGQAAFVHKLKIESL